MSIESLDELYQISEMLDERNAEVERLRKLVKLGRKG